MLPIGDENEPGHGLPFVTLALLEINIAVFIFLQEAATSAAFTYAYSAIPLEITTGSDLVETFRVRSGGEEFLIQHQPGPDPIQLTLITSMFMHGGWLHLAGNMLFLFIFGDNVEHFVGHVIFPVFYLAAGLVATIAQVMVNTESIIPTLGASGAISGVLGAYLVLFPTNRVTVIVFRFPAQVPALVAIGLWAVFQFINGFGALTVSQETTGGVAYMAHIGGFVAGIAGGLIFRGLYGAPVRRSRAHGRSFWG